MHVLDDALYLAETWHRGQRRRHSLSIYLVHVLRVMNRLRRAGVTDIEVLAACLLHDVLEDCKAATRQAIAALCGERVASLVVELTKFPGVSRKEYIESFRTASAWACLIKMADRLDNLYDWPPESVKWYAQEAQRLLVAIEANTTPKPTTEGFPEAWATIHAELTAVAKRLSA